jgi:UDP-N-acetylglucosamine transferase subunit ALG13
MGQEVFVTVGTTSFDKLVAAVDSPTVKEALSRRGFSHLQIQIGCGTYLPSNVCFLFCLILVTERSDPTSLTSSF